MKNIKNYATLERKIFEADTIPFDKLSTASGLQVFTKPFNFKNIELGEDEDKNVVQIRLSTGEFKVDDSLYAIKRMMIDSRSIEFYIFADSIISEKLFTKVMEVLTLLDPKFQHIKPILASIQTECVVTLNVDVMDIFSDRVKVLLTNVADTVKAKTSDIIESVTVKPKIIRFEVTFRPGKKLIDKSLSISDKSLVIEPRLGTTPGERIYYTVSPTDTATHLNILKQLEKSFSQKN